MTNPFLSSLIHLSVWWTLPCCHWPLATPWHPPLLKWRPRVSTCPLPLLGTRCVTALMWTDVCRSEKDKTPEIVSREATTQAAHLSFSTASYTIVINVQFLGSRTPRRSELWHNIHLQCTAHPVRPVWSSVATSGVYIHTACDSWQTWDCS